MVNDGKSSSVWSPDEDAELARLQEIHGNRWALVAAELPGKTGQQCAQRWRHKVNPAIKKEKWTPEEDAQLAKLYEEHGQRWAEIARHLEGRTDQQCMGRWRRHLDPSVKKDAWTDDEDAKLMRLHESLGPRWSNISKMLTGRTAQQCRARWFQLSAAEEEGAEEGTTTVTVTVKSEEGSSRGGKKQRKTPSEPLSPSTPAVTDEDGTVSAIKSEGASSKKRREAAEKAAAAAAAAAPKRRRTLKDAVASKSETAEAEGGSSAGSPNLYGNGGGLDMLAMLYSAAVTYEQGFAAAGGNVPAFPSQLYA